jgi:hypothetical protein
VDRSHCLRRPDQCRRDLRPGMTTVDGVHQRSQGSVWSWRSDNQQNSSCMAAKMCWKALFAAAEQSSAVMSRIMDRHCTYDSLEQSTGLVERVKFFPIRFASFRPPVLRFSGVWGRRVGHSSDGLCSGHQAGRSFWQPSTFRYLTQKQNLT